MTVERNVMGGRKPKEPARQSRSRTCAALCACMLWVLFALTPNATTASTIENSIGFEHFIHTTLEAKHGLPAQANSIVQTPDGYMWFGTPDGLYRYDGQTFNRIPVKRAGAFAEVAIIDSIVTRRGELWLGAGQNAGVVALRGGFLHQTGMKSPPPQITHLIEATDGAIWAASSGSSKRLYRYANNAWQQLDVKLAMPLGAVADLETDRRGTIWVSLASAAGGKLAFLKTGSTKFETADDRIGLGRLTIDQNGGLWVSDNFGTRLLRDPSGARPVQAIAYPPVPNVGFPRIRFDKKGNIWGSSLSGGMFMIPDAANPGNSGKAPISFTRDNRIETLVTLDVFPDREGNIWISSSEALHRFHPANAVPISGVASHPSSPQRLAAASDGSVYLLSLGQLYQMKPNSAPQRVASGLAGNAAICAARSGGVWYLDGAQAIHFRGQTRQSLPANSARDIPILCEEDGYGRLWSLSKGAVSWFRHGRWHQGFPGLGPIDIWDAATDADGALMLSMGASRLLRIDDSKATQMPAKWTGSISSMRTTRLGLLLSDSSGLWRSGIDGLPASSITARPLAKARDFDVDQKNLWVFGLTGVKQLPLAEIGNSWGKTLHQAPSLVIDWSEGLPVGKQDHNFRGRQIVAGSDGRVWVLTRSGPYVIDSRNIIRNVMPPTLVITTVSGDGRNPVTLDDRQTLQGGTRSVRIAYSALSYSLPERVQFKYRLIGMSDKWTFAGNRRDVTFDNLGPGDYRFEVAGANEDGVWNDRPASISFTIAPTFLQSPQVKLIAAILALAAIVAAYHWRTYILTTRVRNAMSVRSAERERIARELHDTLLQSVQALILRFQLLVDHLPQQHPSRTELSTTLDQADEVLSEGRKRVLDLRSAQPRSDLKSVIASVAQRQLPAERFQTEITTTGTVTAIAPIVFNALVDVANECLFNILRHANADRVEVEIRYSPSSLEMGITDNGVGLDASAISDAAITGHFGVVGMHERIANIGGTLRLGSLPDEGLTVTVQIPSSIAYVDENAQNQKKTWRGWPWFTQKAR